jgi:phosphoribosylformimino-5-aminoimidazole carboxamide ribotide isomerase
VLVIPAIDLCGGKCVRLYQGDYSKLTEYSADPVQVGAAWARRGARMLHIVDLDGARAGRPTNLDIVGQIARFVGIPVQLGGGLRSEADVCAAFDAGVARVLIGTAACEDPELVAALIERFGPARIIVSIDCRDGLAATRGWLSSSQTTGADLAAAMMDVGVREFVYTDVSRDGTLRGLDIASIEAMISTGARIIAAGGVGSLDDVQRLAPLAAPDCTSGGLAGVIIGRALYTGDVDLTEALTIAEGRSRKNEQADYTMSRH